MRDTRLFWRIGLVLASVWLLGAAPSMAAPTAEELCSSRMAEASGRYLDCAMRENGRAAKHRRAVNLDRCERKLGRMTTRALRRWGPEVCPSVNQVGGGAMTLGDQLNGLVSQMSEAVGVSDEDLSDDAALCAAKKAKVVGQDLRCRAGALARGALFDRPANETACSERRLARKLARIEKKYGGACLTQGDAGMLAARGQQALSEVTDWVAPSMQNYAGTIDPLPLERLPDADGDGLPDNFEHGISLTDPTLADTDGDGREDGLEVIHHGTHPNIADVAPKWVSGSLEATKYQKNRPDTESIPPCGSEHCVVETVASWSATGSLSESDPASLAGDADDSLAALTHANLANLEQQQMQLNGNLPGGGIASSEAVSEAGGAAAEEAMGTGLLGAGWLLFGAVAQITGFTCEFANCNHHYDPVPGLVSKIGRDVEEETAALKRMDRTFTENFQIVEQLEHRILQIVGEQASLQQCTAAVAAFNHRFPKLNIECPPDSTTGDSSTYHSPACAFQRLRSNFTSTADTAVLADYFSELVTHNNAGAEHPGALRRVSDISVHLNFMAALAPQYLETPSPADPYRVLIQQINEKCAAAIEASHIGSADVNELGGDAVFYSALAKFVHEPLGNYRAALMLQQIANSLPAWYLADDDLKRDAYWLAMQKQSLAAIPALNQPLVDQHHGSSKPTNGSCPAGTVLVGGKVLGKCVQIVPENEIFSRTTAESREFVHRAGVASRALGALTHLCDAWGHREKDPCQVLPADENTVGYYCQRTLCEPTAEFCGGIEALASNPEKNYRKGICGYWRANRGLLRNAVAVGQPLTDGAFVYEPTRKVLWVKDPRRWSGGWSNFEGRPGDGVFSKFATPRWGVRTDDHYENLDTSKDASEFPLTPATREHWSGGGTDLLTVNRDGMMAAALPNKKPHKGHGRAGFAAHLAQAMTKKGMVWPNSEASPWGTCKTGPNRGKRCSGRLDCSFNACSSTGTDHCKCKSGACFATSDRNAGGSCTSDYDCRSFNNICEGNDNCTCDIAPGTANSAAVGGACKNPPGVTGRVAKVCVSKSQKWTDVDCTEDSDCAHVAEPDLSCAAGYRAPQFLWAGSPRWSMFHAGWKANPTQLDWTVQQREFYFGYPLFKSWGYNVADGTHGKCSTGPDEYFKYPYLRMRYHTKTYDHEVTLSHLAYTSDKGAGYDGFIGYDDNDNNNTIDDGDHSMSPVVMLGAWPSAPEFAYPGGITWGLSCNWIDGHSNLTKCEHDDGAWGGWGCSEGGPSRPGAPRQVRRQRKLAENALSFWADKAKCNGYQSGAHFTIGGGRVEHYYPYHTTTINGASTPHFASNDVKGNSRRRYCGYGAGPEHGCQVFDGLQGYFAGSAFQKAGNSDAGDICLYTTRNSYGTCFNPIAGVPNQPACENSGGHWGTAPTPYDHHPAATCNSEIGSNIAIFPDIGNGDNLCQEAHGHWFDSKYNQYAMPIACGGSFRGGCNGYLGANTRRGLGDTRSSGAGWNAFRQCLNFAGTSNCAHLGVQTPYLLSKKEPKFMTTPYYLREVWAEDGGSLPFGKFRVLSPLVTPSGVAGHPEMVASYATNQYLRDGRCGNYHAASVRVRNLTNYPLLQESDFLKVQVDQDSGNTQGSDVLELDSSLSSITSQVECDAHGGLFTKAEWYREIQTGDRAKPGCWVDDLRGKSKLPLWPVVDMFSPHVSAVCPGRRDWDLAPRRDSGASYSQSQQVMSASPTDPTSVIDCKEKMLTLDHLDSGRQCGLKSIPMPETPSPGSDPYITACHTDEGTKSTCFETCAWMQRCDDAAAMCHGNWGHDDHTSGGTHNVGECLPKALSRVYESALVSFAGTHHGPSICCDDASCEAGIQANLYPQLPSAQASWSHGLNNTRCFQKASFPVSDARATGKPYCKHTVGGKWTPGPGADSTYATGTGGHCTAHPSFAERPSKIYKTDGVQECYKLCKENEPHCAAFHYNATWCSLYETCNYAGPDKNLSGGTLYLMEEIPHPEPQGLLANERVVPPGAVYGNRVCVNPALVGTEGAGVKVLLDWRSNASCSTDGHCTCDWVETCESGCAGEGDFFCSATSDRNAGQRCDPWSHGSAGPGGSSDDCKVQHKFEHAPTTILECAELCRAHDGHNSDVQYPDFRCEYFSHYAEKSYDSGGLVPDSDSSSTTTFDWGTARYNYSCVGYSKKELFSDDAQTSCEAKTLPVGWAVWPRPETQTLYNNAENCAREWGTPTCSRAVTEAEANVFLGVGLLPTATE